MVLKFDLNFRTWVIFQKVLCNENVFKLYAATKYIFLKFVMTAHNIIFFSILHLLFLTVSYKFLNSYILLLYTVYLCNVFTEWVFMVKFPTMQVVYRIWIEIFIHRCGFSSCNEKSIEFLIAKSCCWICKYLS